MNYQLVATTALSSGAAVALVEFLLHRFREGKEKNRHTKFLALEVCVCLERYAVQIADAMSEETETEVAPGRYVYGLISRVPELPSLPESEHYDKFDLDLLGRIYEFPDKIALANGMVNFMASTQDHEVAMSEATKEATKIASNAVDLAAEIRVKYSLPERVLVYGAYDVRSILTTD